MTESDIHHPTDSSLLNHAARVLNRLRQHSRLTGITGADQLVVRRRIALDVSNPGQLVWTRPARNRASPVVPHSATRTLIVLPAGQLQKNLCRNGGLPLFDSACIEYR